MLVGKDLGPFRIEAELGSGAMGSVFRGRYRDSGKAVAIKVIAFGLLGNETAVRRFEREADILKQLRHPNIVRFIGTGSYKRTPFFIMEYVEGDSLDHVLARRGAFPWDEVVVLGRQLCAALQHAHEKGIIHRDLKPSNLMILRDDTLKLTDFGIAKDMDVTALTAANLTVGTAAYMSPEQCRGEKTVSSKSDLYSMGVVFYELLTGKKPFQADSPIEMFRQHVEGTFERPSRTVMDIPVWLDTHVCHLLEKKPEHRPYDAAMVAKVLEEVEQKVAEQRSAGVDAATAKVGDKGTKRPAGETERDVARTLRGAVGKKKFRRKRVPLTQRKWVQAVMLSSALLGLAGLVYAFTRPPSAERLYRAVQIAAEAHDAEAVSDASARYLRLYGGRDDDATRQVLAWDRASRVDRRVEQLHNRIFGKFKQKPVGDAEKLAFEAIKQENSGDMAAAYRAWAELQDKVKGSDDADEEVYGWVAQKKLADLSALSDREKKLKDAVDYEHALVRSGPKPDLDLVGRACLDAYRLQSFGDLPAARDRWTAIRDENLKSLEDRGWAILAAVKARETKELAVSGKDAEREFRRKLLTDRLAAAEAVPQMTDPEGKKRAVSICRDVIGLYGRDPDPAVNAFARKASQLLRDRGWS
jgi:tRNA A-37 threonylcarbamoyl transferase component Bud32